MECMMYHGVPYSNLPVVVASAMRPELMIELFVAVVSRKSNRTIS